MAGKVGEQDGDNSDLGTMTRTEQDAIYKLVERDVQRYYPQGLPGNMELIKNSDFAGDGSGTFMSGLIVKNLIAWLNQEDVQFNDDESMQVVNFHLLPYQVELDGDTGSEWLLQVTNGQLAYFDWVYLDEAEAARYSLIPNDPLTIPFGTSLTKAEVEHDLTGDGLVEVVFTSFDYVWGSEFGFVQVFTWNGTRMVKLLELEHYLRSTDFMLENVDIEFKISDANGDSLEEIQVRLPRSANFGCKWEEVDTYRWQGDQPVFQSKGANPPETPICWAAQALDPSAQLTPEQKAQLLEKALNNLSASSTPANLQALLRVHLSVAYSMAGKDAQAQQALAGLERIPSSEGLVKTIQDEYQSANSSLLKLCDGLYHAAQSGTIPDDHDIVSELSYSSSLGVYPNDPSTIYPIMVCPLPALAKHLLEGIQLPASSPPLEVLKTAGFPIGDSAEVQLDKDKELEIAALVELAEPQIIVLDKDQDQWQVSRAARLSAHAEAIEFIAYDIYEDDQIELLVSASLAEPVPYSAFSKCWMPDAGQTNEYLAIQSLDRHFDAFWGDELCGKQGTLEQFVENGIFEFALMQGSPLESNESLAEINRRRYAFSEEELAHVEHNEDIYRGMDELLDEILTGNAQIPIDQKTKIMMSFMSSDSPGEQRISQRMLYFTGIYYELNGQADQATAVYERLVQTWPDSIWSWLAWARLKPASGTTL